MTTVWKRWQQITWRRGRKHWTSCNSSPMISWPLRCPLSLVTRPPETCLPGERGMRLSTLPGLRKDFVRACDPALVEEVKWKKPSRPEEVPVWSHDGILCFCDTLKNAVRLTFPKGAQMRDPHKLFHTRRD